LLKMFKIMIEFKNVRSEKAARYLSKLTDGFNLWTHDNAVHALFDKPITEHYASIQIWPLFHAFLICARKCLSPPDTL